MTINEAIEIIDDIISDYEYRCNCEDEEDEQQEIMLKIEALQMAINMLQWKFKEG